MSLCKYCNFNLDIGDIYEVLRASENYMNDDKAYEAALMYGWSENNKKRFDKSLLIKDENGNLYATCPNCDSRLDLENTTESEQKRKPDKTLQTSCIKTIKDMILQLPVSLQEEILEECSGSIKGSIRKDVEARFVKDLSNDVSYLVSSTVQTALSSGFSAEDAVNSQWWNGWNALYNKEVIDISKTCIKKILFVLRHDSVIFY